jgi:hypothetical protein
MTEPFGYVPRPLGGACALSLLSCPANASTESVFPASLDLLLSSRGDRSAVLPLRRLFSGQL